MRIGLWTGRARGDRKAGCADCIGVCVPRLQCARNHDSVCGAHPARMVDRCGICDAAAGDVPMYKVPMCRMLPWLGLTLAFALVAQAQAMSLPPRYESLAEAEREFASAGAREGIQKSFLAHFAEDALVFRPFATAAPAWYREHPDGLGKLIWGPQ